MTEPHLPTPAPACWHIRVQPDNVALSASGEDTVLQAALAAGLDWPSACRNGTCRTCMGHILQGEIRYQIEWPGLSAEEKADGYFLPCVACALSDLEVMLPG